MFHNDSRRRTITYLSVGTVLLSLGCSAGDDSGYDEEAVGLRSQSLTGDDEFPVDAPDELVIDGRRYVRESSLNPGELQQLKNPKLWEPPADLDKVAQLVREYIQHPEYGEYVEDRPNYALARISLGIDKSPLGVRGNVPESTPATEVREKRISTNGDQRVRALNGSSSPANAIAMYEAGGSAVHLGSSRMYTAGHVLYQNSVGNPNGPTGWICSDGSISSTGSCTGLTRTKSRFQFGAIINNPGPNETWASIGGWTSSTCGIRGIPAAWKNLPVSPTIEAFAAADYGRANLSGCLPVGVGGLPWWIASQADLRSHSLNAYGYPFLTSCPAGARGVVSDCPNGVNQLRTTGANPPISAGSMFLGVPITDTSLIAQNGYIKSNKVDTTVNMSGGPMVAFDTVPSSQWWVVGVDSASSPNVFAETFYNQLTSTVVNYVYQ